MANKSIVLSYPMIDTNKYEYFHPCKTENGYFLSACKYKLNKNEIIPIYIETPILITTSGIVKIEKYFYIDLELPISSPDNSKSFYNFLIECDESNIHQCHQKSKEWFGNPLPLHIVEEYYKSSIIHRPGKLPILRIKLPSYKGKVLTEIYNNQRELVDSTLLSENDQLIGIVEFVGLHFQSKKFIPEFEIHKIKILKNTTSNKIINGYLFSDKNNPNQPITNISKSINPVSHQSNILSTNFDIKFANYLTASNIYNPKTTKKETQEIISQDIKQEHDNLINSNQIPNTQAQKTNTIDNNTIAIGVSNQDSKINSIIIDSNADIVSNKNNDNNTKLEEEENLFTMQDTEIFANLEEDLNKLYQDNDPDNDPENKEIDNYSELDELEIPSSESDESEQDDLEMDDSDLLELELVF